jgi:hypothetical protein
MAEYIDRKKLMDDISKYSIENYAGLIRNVVMKQPVADVVSRELFEQMKWERDIALEQLRTYGIPFGGRKEDNDGIQNR